MTEFAVAGIQLDVSTADNRYQIKKEIERTCARYPWVQMIVVGELATFGSDPAHAEPFPGETEAFYARIARDCGVWLIPGSIFERDGESVYNTSSVLDPEGRVVGRYRKLFPFRPYEKNVTAGTDTLVFDIPGVGRAGLCICYDQWFPEVIRNLVWQGAEFILCPTMTNTIDRDQELCLARANAIANQCYLVSVNVTGSLGNGRSIVAGPEGEVLYVAGETAETLPLVLDLAHLRRVRERGTQGLGQVLKSFRDSEMTFPVYEPGARATGALTELGELAMYERNKDGTQ